MLNHNSRSEHHVLEPTCSPVCEPEASDRFWEVRDPNNKSPRIGFPIRGELSGGADGDRTHDLSIANAALSQLSYGPIARMRMVPQETVWRKTHPRESSLEDGSGSVDLEGNIEGCLVLDASIGADTAAKLGNLEP